MTPLIVPPTAQKLQADGPLDFEVLWARAHQFMQGCVELFFVGYSFPPADIQFRMLVAAALQGNERLKRIVVITSPKYGLERVAFEDSYAQVFRGTRHHDKIMFWYEKFETWVRSPEETEREPFGHSPANPDH
jgi:hypothetical protein